MSTTSLLYHAFGARGYRCLRTDFHEAEVIFTIDQPRERYRCSQCGSAHVLAHGGETRLFRTVPIGTKPTRLLFKVPCVECRDCHTVRQVRVDFAEPRRSYTHAFERYALELSRSTTIQDAARHLDVNWDTVKDIQARYLQRRKPRGNSRLAAFAVGSRIQRGLAFKSADWCRLCPRASDSLAPLLAPRHRGRHRG